MSNYNDIPTSEFEIHPLEGFGRQRRVGGAIANIDRVEIREEWWIGKLGEMHVAETLKLAGMEAPKNGASVLQAMLREYWLDTDKVYPIPVVLARFRGWVLLARQMGGYRAELLDRIFRFPERGACSTYNRAEELIWMFRHFPSPKKIGADHYRGIRWMMNQQLRIPRTFKSGEVRRLGRVSPWARHCLTRFHYGKGLNYSALADAQKGNRAADKVLGACVNLAARMGVGLRTVMRVSWNDWDRNGYRASDFKAEDLPKAGMLVRGMIEGFHYANKDTAAGLVLNLLAIYPDAEHMLRSPMLYNGGGRAFSMSAFERWLMEVNLDGKGGSSPGVMAPLLHLRMAQERLHDASMAIPVRPKDIPLKQWRQWGPLLDQAPTQTTSSRSKLVEIYRHLGRVPSSVDELLAVSEELFPHGGLNLTDVERDFITRTAKKDHECIPAPRGIVEGQYELRQLAHDDPRNITVGSEVMCCQHLGGAAASAVRDLWINPAAAIWAVFDRRSDQVVAQALVWRSRARSQQPRRRLGADLDGDVDDFSEVHFPLTLPHADFPRPNLGRGFIEARFPTMQFYPNYDEGLTNRLEYCNRIAVNSRILAIPHQHPKFESSFMSDEDYGRGDTLVLDSVEALGGHRTPRIAGLFIRAADAAVGKLGVKWVYASGLSHGVGPVLKELALARLDRSGHAHDVQEKTEEAVGTILPSNALRIVYRDFNRRNSVFLASTWFPNALTRAEVL